MQRLEQRNQDCGFQQHKTNSKTEAISIDKEKNIQKQLIGMNIVLIETIKCHTLIAAYHSRKLSLFHNHHYSLIHLHLPLDSWTAMAASPRLTQWGTYIWSTRFHPHIQEVVNFAGCTNDCSQTYSAWYASRYVLEMLKILLEGILLPDLSL